MALAVGLSSMWWLDTSPPPRGNDPSLLDSKRDSPSVVERQVKLAPILYDTSTPSRQRHSFSLENTTGDRVEFLEPRTSCGCTHAVIEPSILAPGGSVTVQLDIDVARFAGQKSLSILLPAAKNGPTWRVSVNAAVYPRAAFANAETYLGELAPNTDSESVATLNFYSESEKSLGKVDAVTCSDPAVSIEMQSGTVDQVSPTIVHRQVTFRSRLKLPTEVGPYTAEIVVNEGTSLEARHQLVISLLVESQVCIR